MNVLIIGSGGREHALAWKISQSQKLSRLYVCPGNTGTSKIAENLNIDPLDFDKTGSFCKENDVNLIVVGPEAPLVNGITDHFKKDSKLRNIPIVGPSADGALIEGSKEFAKKFMKKYHIPSADYSSFNIDQRDAALKHLQTISAPYVIKADGLASGKGVVITEKIAEAESTVKAIFDEGKFGNAGDKIVIEEFLTGIELSVFVLTDGNNYVLLPEAKDYKRIGKGDTGLNTGGMGAVSPVPFADNHFMNKVEKEIIKPTIDGLNKENIDYKGFVFFGLMKVGDQPYVIEYNCRLGDPEAEVILPRIEDDLLDLCFETANGELQNKVLNFKDEVASTFVLVSGGYPEKYEKGNIINGIENIDPEILTFHAGTGLNDKGELINNGGRVIALTSKGASMDESLNKGRLAAETIYWKDKYYRSDIGYDLL